MNRDSKSFFTYERSKSKVKTFVSPLKDNNGNVISDSQNMCSWLNDFFALVFTKENLAELPEAKRTFFGSTEEWYDFHITSGMVETKLKGLKQNKSAGVDGIGFKMLIGLADVIADTVSCLFRKSLSSGDIPDNWNRRQNWNWFVVCWIRAIQSRFFNNNETWAIKTYKSSCNTTNHYLESF